MQANLFDLFLKSIIFLDMSKSKIIINSGTAKQENRLSALNLLHNFGAISRAEITNKLGCDGTTTTNIIRDLMNEGLVQSKGICHGSNRGRPKELIALNPESRVALGVSFHPGFVSAILTDLNGECKIRDEVFFESGISQDVFLNLTKKLCRRIVSRIEPKKLVGLGVATFGVLSPSKYAVTHAEYFPALEGLELQQFFMNEFGLKPCIIDGAYALALGEMWWWKGNIPNNFVLLELGIGIGCAIIANGQPYFGAGGFANEFGHIVLKPDGESCQFGHCGCLETLAAFPSIKRNISLATGIANLGYDMMVKNYLDGKEPYRKIVNESAKWLGIGIANLINFAVPEQVILTGMLLEFGNDYLEIVDKNIMSTAFPSFTEQFTIKTSQAGNEGAAAGAAVLVLRKFFGY